MFVNCQSYNETIDVYVNNIRKCKLAETDVINEYFNLSLFLDLSE
jgi:hypothetical protein